MTLSERIERARLEREAKAQVVEAEHTRQRLQRMSTEEAINMLKADIRRW